MRKLKKFSHQNLANNLNLSLREVIDAWNYWEERNVIQKKWHSDQQETDDNAPATPAFDVIFVSLKQLHLEELHYVEKRSNNHYTETSHHYSTLEPASFTASPTDVMSAVREPELRDLFGQINKIMQRSLVPNEQMEVLQWIQHYNLEPEIVRQAFLYAVQQREVRSVRYVGGIIRNWQDQGT